MILEPLFGLSLVLNASLNLQNHAAAGASPWTQMSVRQKDAALLPLVRQATDCIVHRVFGHPRYRADLRADEINDLIVDSMAACMRPVRAMIDAHDRMYGAGSGEAFLLGTLSRRLAGGGGGSGQGQSAKPLTFKPAVQRAPAEA